jgi:DNA-binding Lrp family transcriptional regulator
MDNTDKQLLNIIQTGFPVTSKPYEALGKKIGISSSEALSRTRELVECGIIRKIGASFDTRKLDHVSALVAAKAPAERIEEVVRIISSFEEVTHSYERDHEYNLWFTLVCENGERLDAVLDEIANKTGIKDIHELPAERTFKIKVDFEF